MGIAGKLLGLLAATVAVVIASLAIGSVRVPVPDVLDALRGRADPTAQTIVTVTDLDVIPPAAKAESVWRVEAGELSAA